MSWRSNQGARRSRIANQVHSDRRPGPGADRFVTPQRVGDLKGPGIKLTIRSGRVVAASVG